MTKQEMLDKVIEKYEQKYNVLREMFHSQELIMSEYLTRSQHLEDQEKKELEEINNGT